MGSSKMIVSLQCSIKYNTHYLVYSTGQTDTLTDRQPLLALYKAYHSNNIIRDCGLLVYALASWTEIAASWGLGVCMLLNYVHLNSILHMLCPYSHGDSRQKS